MRGYKILKPLFAVCLTFSTAFATQADYWNEGTNTANSILGEVKGNMNERVNNPIANGQKLYTLDNSQSGDASITCSEEKPILKISYSVGGGGDIDIYVNEDLDLNGNYEKSFSVNGVSGICANGFIKCDSGTWQHCEFYQLYFNGNNFYYQQTDNSNLVQCYCINNSCGDISANSKNRVLSDIAGAFASLINKNYYIVSGINLNGNYAYVNGKSINCGGEQVPMGMSSDELQSKTEEMKTEGISDKNSTYYILNQTTENVNNNPVDSSFKNDLLNKQSSIQSSANWDNSNQQYSYADNGQTINGNIYVGDITKSEYCEIGYVNTSTDVFGDKSNRANSTSSDNVNKTEIIECVKNSSGQFICPVKSGQKIIHNCGKVDDLPKIAGAFSAINQAVKDFTCSTN